MIALEVGREGAGLNRFTELDASNARTIISTGPEQIRHLYIYNCDGNGLDGDYSCNHSHTTIDYLIHIEHLQLRMLTPVFMLTYSYRRLIGVQEMDPLFIAHRPHVAGN